MPVTLQQVVSLPDVLLQDHFDLLIPNPPGGGDGEALMIRNMTAVLPGRSNRPIPVELHRHKTFYGGKRDYGNSFSASWVDTTDRRVINTLKSWQDLITDPTTGLPLPKTVYNTTATITIYDASNAPSELRTFHGLFIVSLEASNLSGSSNQPLPVSATFSFDYWTDGAF